MAAQLADGAEGRQGSGAGSEEDLRRGPGHARGSRGRHRARSASERTALLALAAVAPIHLPDSRASRPAEQQLDALAVLGDLGVEEPAPRRERKQGVGAFLREVAIIALTAIVIAVLVRGFLVRPYYIPSTSMQDTLMVDDRIIVSLLTPTPFAISRGDVVVFNDPGGWLSVRPSTPGTPVQEIVDRALEAVGLRPSGGEDSLIKRVIGLPGDHVLCCDASGRLVINDVSITEPYLRAGAVASTMSFDVVVPADSLWVMGDNRENSEDSRYHQDEPGGGFVPVDSVVGRAVVINFPFDRLTILGNYPEVFAAVPSREPFS